MFDKAADSILQWQRNNQRMIDIKKQLSKQPYGFTSPTSEFKSSGRYAPRAQEDIIRNSLQLVPKRERRNRQVWASQDYSNIINKHSDQLQLQNYFDKPLENDVKKNYQLVLKQPLQLNSKRSHRHKNQKLDIRVFEANKPKALCYYSTRNRDPGRTSEKLSITYNTPSEDQAEY